MATIQVKGPRLTLLNFDILMENVCTMLRNLCTIIVMLIEKMSGKNGLHTGWRTEVVLQQTRP